MRPTLFEVFGYAFNAYPTMLGLAFITGTLLASRSSERFGGGYALNPQVGIWAFLGALIGAKAFYILQYRSPQDIWRALLIWQPGLVYYGGLLGGLGAVAICLRIQKAPLLKIGDIGALYLPLGQAITRIGCFLNGCCWGTTCSMPWCVRFPPGSNAFNQHVRAHLITRNAEASLPVHPTQLYMMLGLLVVFAIQWAYLRRKRFDGALCLSYMVLYGLLRFVVEFYRADSARSLWGLTVSQAISAALIGSGLAGFAAVTLWARLCPSSRPPKAERIEGPAANPTTAERED
jgi:phosphatidylglycerol---prolipoprotein diacylglyceryl transferase